MAVFYYITGYSAFSKHFVTVFFIITKLQIIWKLFLLSVIIVIRQYCSQAGNSAVNVEFKGGFYYGIQDIWRLFQRHFI